METPKRAIPGGYTPTPAIEPPKPLPATIELSAVERAAKTINATLMQERDGYPDLESYVAQGISSDIDFTAGAPFQKVKAFPIPDSILVQYNRAQMSTIMGLFAELNQAWVTIDNALYMWEYKNPTPVLVGFEEQPHSITAVRLLKPREGVFLPHITRVLVIATTDQIIIVGVSAEAQKEGGYKIELFSTGIVTSIKGLDITCIEGDDSGRIFFSGSDNDVYELYYQIEEKWFFNRCWKINQTTSRLAALTPSIGAFNFSNKAPVERTIQLAADKSRQLLYVLSSTSTIRVFHMKPNYILDLVITKPLKETLNHIAHMVQTTELLGADTRIVSIQPIASQESTKLHLMATTSTGCRIYMSATSSFGYLSSGHSTIPTSMQVHHVRFPPPELSEIPSSQNANSAIPAQVRTTSKSLIETRSATRYAPGYFLCFVTKGVHQKFDSMFMTAPNTGRIARSSDPAQGYRFLETGSWLELDGRVEDVGLVTEPFSASSSPIGFGNELAVQHDKPTAEIAILSNSGVQTIRRMRLVDIFATALRTGKGDEGLEGEIRNFIRNYGRSETAASALAVACGQGLDVTSDYRVASITDPDVLDHARTAFIEHGGKPQLNENGFVDQSVSTIDMVKPSPRHDGLALYISRIVRSLWKYTVITESSSPGQGLSIKSTISADKLQDVQQDLTKLREFLSRNRSFIDGLAGPEAMDKVSTKQDEVQLQAEHRALHALVTLISNIIEGISFVQMLFEERLEEIIIKLPDEQRGQVQKLSYEGLFCTAAGRNLAKELVKAIVNRNIENGSNVDTVADKLRRRCGSFCSASDVIIFKAQEQLKRATESGGGTEFGRNLLNESLRLFKLAVDSLAPSQLQSAVDQYIAMHFYAGAIELALDVAQQKDRGNRALAWIENGRPEQDPNKPQDPGAKAFAERKQCYTLVQKVILALDQIPAIANDVSIAGARDSGTTRDPSLEARLKPEAYSVIENSDDEVFQTDLYDWYLFQGQADRLLQIQSPYVIKYLERRGPEDIAIADLLWRYFSQTGRPYDAAQCQLDLAKADFPLTLDRRIEYLSRAKANASTYAIGPGRSSRQKLLRNIVHFLEAASIQCDILERLKSEERLTPERREGVLRAVGGQIMTLDELYTQYADNAGYYDICILIYHAADHRRPMDIKNTWQNLLQSTHDKAVQSGDLKPYEAVADIVRVLGTRVNLSENTFPVNELLPMLKRYAFANQRGVGPEHWVVDTFLDVQVPFESIFAVLQGMLYNDEVPFHGNNRHYIANDILYISQRWFEETRTGKPMGSVENATEVLGTLQQIVSNGLSKNLVNPCQDLRAQIDQLLR